MTTDILFDHFHHLITRAEDIPRLNELILQLAVQGRLVAQNPTDEPASELLKRIKAEKARLVEAGEIRKSKPLPPISVDEIPFELPKGWGWCRFPEVGELARGQSKHRPRNDPKLYDGGKYPFVQTGEVARSGGKITNYTTMYGEMGLAQSRMWPKGTLCITIAANIAETGILQFDACFPDSVVGFIPSEIIGTAEYFQYFMNVVKSQLNESASATAQKNINLGILQSLPIPLPPLAEQQRIVERVEQLLDQSRALEAELTAAEAERATLTRASLHHLTTAPNPTALREQWQQLAPTFDTLLTDPAAVDNLKQAILQLAVQGRLVAQNPTDEPASELLKRIKAEKARLVEAGKIRKSKPLPPVSEDKIPFDLPRGWEWVRMGDISIKLGAGNTPKGGRKVYQESGIKFIRSQNVWNDGLKLDGIAHISNETNQRMSNSVVLPKDVLLNITGASIGRSAVVPNNFDTANVNQHVAIIRLVDLKIRHFVHICLISQYIQNLIMDVQVGISREGLSMGRLARFALPLPPLAEQQRIVERVEQLLALCDDLQAQLVAGETARVRLLKSLLWQAGGRN